MIKFYLRFLFFLIFSLVRSILMIQYIKFLTSNIYYFVMRGFTLSSVVSMPVAAAQKSKKKMREIPPSVETSRSAPMTRME